MRALVAKASRQENSFGSMAPKLFILLVVWWGVAGLPNASSMGRYDQAMIKASNLEKQGKYSQAAEELLAIRGTFRDDYTLNLYLGWLSYLAGDYETAAKAYKDASILSGQATDPVLGLGWTHLKWGNTSIARRYFREVLRKAPDNASAKEGMGLSRVPWSLSITLSGAWHTYMDHPGKEWAAGPAGELGWSYDWFFGNFVYRTTSFEGPPVSAPIPFFDPNNRLTFSQEEFFLNLGYQGDKWSIEAGGVLGNDKSSAGLDTITYGAIASWSPFGTFIFDASWSEFADLDAPVWRGELLWETPEFVGISLVPTVRFQEYDSETYTSGSFTVQWRRKPVEIYLGGKYGDEFRPVSLRLSTLGNIREVIEWGAWAGAKAWVSKHVAISVVWEMNQIDSQKSLGRISGENYFQARSQFFIIGVEFRL